MENYGVFQFFELKNESKSGEAVTDEVEGCRHRGRFCVSSCRLRVEGLPTVPAQLRSARARSDTQNRPLCPAVRPLCPAVRPLCPAVRPLCPAVS